MRNIKEIGKKSSREKMISIFKETMKICYEGEYGGIDIRDRVRDAIEGTEYFESDFMISLEELELSKRDVELKIEVTRESTVEAGIRVGGGILALNFASGVSVGGNVVGGAIAQEEDLCRCSGLYSCLESEYVKEYYEVNRLSGNSLYTDSMIYSPNVIFFRDHWLRLLDVPFEMSILTVPAPCLRDLDMDDDFREGINLLLEVRIRKMLRLAAYKGHREIILGAWGCGAFRNDPYDVSKIFEKILRGEMVGLFDRVIFAVYAKDEEDINYKIFKECFEKKLK